MPAYSVTSGSTQRSSSSRRKATPLDEKPLLKCCNRKLRRSSFQAYGLIVSLSRICAYAAIIGGLQQWPIVQTSLLLTISVLYFGYLRFTVPYSRRDEMALEYWTSFLDMVVFGLFIYLAAGINDTDFGTIDAIGYGLIGTQCAMFFSYLINRILIIFHAFVEIIFPVCALPNHPKKRKRSRHSRSRSGISRSESLSYSISDMSINPVAFSAESKEYYGVDGKDNVSISGSETGTNGLGAPNSVFIPPPQVQQMQYAQQQFSASNVGRSNERITRSGMFPSIAEETESQVGSPIAGAISSAAAARSARAPGPRAMPVSNLEEDDTSRNNTPSPAAPSRRPLPNELPRSASNNDNAVFDRFWKSL